MRSASPQRGNGRSECLFTPDRKNTPTGMSLFCEVNNARSPQRKICKEEEKQEGEGGAGNELKSGKLHLQGSPPAYNESV